MARLILSIDPAASKADAFSAWETYPEVKLVDFGWIEDPLDLLSDIQASEVLYVEDQYMHKNFKVAKQLITKVGFYQGLHHALGKDPTTFRLVNAATWKSKHGLLLSKEQNQSMTKNQRKKYKEQMMLDKAIAVIRSHGYDHEIDVDVASAVLIPLAMEALNV